MFPSFKEVVGDGRAPARGIGLTPPRAAVGLRRGRRERVSSLRCLLVIARSSCDEAIHAFFPRRRGLLRCARNDGEGAHLPTRYSVIARSSCDEAIHAFFPRRDGLLRSARNDGEGAYPAPSSGRTSSRPQGESHQPLAVLAGAARQVGRDTGVERSVTPACHDVDARFFLRLRCVPSDHLTPSLRGAQRRSNPRFLSVAAWIASLALAMTGRECGPPHARDS